MEALLLSIARLLEPDIESGSITERKSAALNVFGVLYATPLVILGIAWLITATDLALYYARWPIMLLILALLILLDHLSFFVQMEWRKGRFADWKESLATVVVWSTVLVFGPSVLWVSLLHLFYTYVRWWRQQTERRYWVVLRNCAISVAQLTLGTLSALALYEHWGGTFPPPDLSSGTLLPALGATFAKDLIYVAILLPYIVASSRAVAPSEAALRTLVKFWSFTSLFNFVIDPFSLLGAVLYAQNGLNIYLIFTAAVVLTSYLAHQLSRVATRSRQRSRELARLEALGRELLNTPPNDLDLSDILEEHVAYLFPYTNIEIRIFGEGTLLRNPPETPSPPPTLWEWLRTTRRAHAFEQGSILPWTEDREKRSAQRGIIAAPILDAASGKPIGGIYLTRQETPEALESVINLLPAVQSVTAQIASALHSARVYRQTLEYQKAEQELALAGHIQASFLPKDLPEVPGWKIAARLIPARETSGDFYDLIPLSNGLLGIVIADVADKGTAAALYMALSRTLIRTYALQYLRRPDYVLKAANRRILMDTDTDHFVTIFYGVLDPVGEILTYANAGHNPPYLLNAHNHGVTRCLLRTGMPLGIFEGPTWEQKEVQITAEDLLILYTDGVTDAENESGNFYGTERLLKSIERHRTLPADELHARLLDEVQEFSGKAPQFDDITLMVLKHTS